jgi:hypothetical protein
MQIGACEEIQFNTLIPKDSFKGILRGKYNPSDFYIDIETHEAHKKKIMMVSSEGGSVKNVPEGSTFMIRELDNMSTAIRSEDTVVEIDRPGEYHVKVMHPEYHSRELTIKVE